MLSQNRHVEASHCNPSKFDYILTMMSQDFLIETLVEMWSFTRILMTS